MLVAGFSFLVAVRCGAAGTVDEWVRYFEARNALANMMLAPQHAMRGQSVPERPESATRMPCPFCGGKGEVVTQEPDYGQWEGRLNKGGKKTRRSCPLCEGRKGWAAYYSPRELYAVVTQARGIFMATHQARGEIAVGQAFVPRAMHEGAHRKQLKLVEEAYGKSCPKCEWTGIEECKKCKGAGKVKCDGNECKGGWIVTKTVTQQSSSSSPSRSRSCCSSRRSSGSRRTTRRETVTVKECPICQGAGMRICPECGGRCAQPCSKCHGLGIRQKH